MKVQELQELMTRPGGSLEERGDIWQQAIHEVVRTTLETNAINRVGTACEQVTWPWPTSGPVWSRVAGRVYDRERDS